MEGEAQSASLVQDDIYPVGYRPPPSASHRPRPSTSSPLAPRASQRTARRNVQGSPRESRPYVSPHPESLYAPTHASI